MRAVCVNRGIPAWGAMLVAPRFVPEPESNGAGVFEELSSWIVDNCQTAEVGIVSYHTGPAVLSFVSGADEDGYCLLHRLQNDTRRLQRTPPTNDSSSGISTYQKAAGEVLSEHNQRERPY